MSPEVRLELQQLLSDLCDGNLGAEQHARLEALLDGDAECRLIYLAYVDMHAHLLIRPQLFGSTPTMPVAPDRTRRGWTQIIRYGLVVSATLAASLLVQFLWRPLAFDDTHNGTVAPPAVKVAAPPAYVATLTQTPDCVWDQARIGPRLQPGELRLQKGIARIRFDSGSDLVVEGPIGLRVDSGAATLLHGKVVVRAEETAAPFDLHTPCSTLVNFAAECAVSVGNDGEEVHVFDGEVQRTARTGAAAPEVLSAGDARRYGPAPESPGQPMPLDRKAFTRELADPAPPAADPAAGLLAYEGFDYSSGNALRTDKAGGGLGWTSRWLPGLTRPLLEGDGNLSALNPKESLVRPGSAALSGGGSFDYIGFAKYHRRLATPVRLDTDGVYYLSFLFRREGPPADPLNALAILLRSTDELQKGREDARKRLNIGIGGPNQLFTHLDKIGSRTPLPLRYGETYLLVAKIAASSTGPAQVFLRVYGPDEVIELEESSAWTVAGPPFPSRQVFDWLEIHINSKTRQTIDEIRLGTTWSSVTAPWRPKKNQG
jgi:hypothetical protein